jgi:hypothetical protein
VLQKDSQVLLLLLLGDNSSNRIRQFLQPCSLVWQQLWSTASNTHLALLVNLDQTLALPAIIMETKSFAIQVPHSP